MGEWFKNFFKDYDAAGHLINVFVFWVAVVAVFYVAMMVLGVVARSRQIDKERWFGRVDSVRDRFDILGFFALVGCSVLVPIDFYVSHFGGRPMSSDPEQWGQMGDFFGGMLNPILAFASFMALLYTIRIQSATQREATANAKADRALSILIPEYHRHEQHITGLFNEADRLVSAALHPEGGVYCSINELVGNAFLKSIEKHESAGTAQIRHSFKDIGDLINEQLMFGELNAFGVVDKYFQTVISIKRGSFNIIQVTKRIEALNDMPLFRDKYETMAKHLITAELLSRSAICFNRYGIGVGYLINNEEQLQKEINRMATESLKLTIDTP